jgi:hypothetical protein
VRAVATLARLVRPRRKGRVKDFILRVCEIDWWV